MKIDDAQQNFSNLKSEIAGNLQNIISEEDAKIQIIVRLLVEVLGWDHTDIGAERKNDNGFSDFILSIRGGQAFLLEAKKIGALNIATKEEDKLRYLKLNGSTLKDIQEGIEQAASYAAPHGMTIAVLTDGIRWVVFKSFVSGADYKEKEAFVFPSLEAIWNNFSDFYELLSKECFSRKLYTAYFDKLHNKRLLLSQTLKPPFADYDIKPLIKTDIAFDLDQIFSAFFNRLTGDEDEELLVECFVETRESRIADFALEKITANVLGNISPANKQVDEELSNLIQNIVELESGQTIFIVGPTGAGKTTFLSRFFKKTLSPVVRKQCIVVSVNCLDSSGREDTALKWLTEHLISKLEEEMYEDGCPSFEQLKGLYYSDYKRRQKIDENLYRNNLDAFNQKFIDEFLDKKVEEDREGYLRRILADAVRNRHKLPILLIDNTDEFTEDFKREIFQFSQSLRRAINYCLLIFPVTDKSAWSFSKTDLYSIYKSKSFFLPTPPPREVFRKRIDFIRSKLKDLSSENEKRQYMAKKGIRVSIANIEGFASVIENVFVDHEYTAKTIGEIANYNIRNTLALSQRIITSPVYEIGDLLKAVISGGMSDLSFTKFMNALLKGDYEFFKQNDRHFIYPIYQVNNQIKQSPLLPLRLLALLRATKNGARTVEDKHLSVDSLLNYFDSMGCSEAALNETIIELLESGLVEPYDSSVRYIEPNQRLAITYSGLRHYDLSVFNYIFFEQMALTTAIVNHDIADQIRSMYRSDKAYKDKMQEIRSLFLNYLINEDALHVHVPESVEQFNCQLELTENLKKLDVLMQAADNQKTLGAISEEDVCSAVIAVVDWYNPEQGFGFVEVEGEDFQAFLHAEVLQNDQNTDRVFDGDKILCDVAQNHKGHYVKKVHDFEAKDLNVEIVDAKVIKMFPDRRYGFVQVAGGSRSAFFHYSNIEEKILESLAIGQDLSVEICPDKTGEGFQVRRVIN
ncbi:MAG: cold shock domain-containing protein [Alcanivorax sp.]